MNNVLGSVSVSGDSTSVFGGHIKSDKAETISITGADCSNCFRK